MINVSSDKVINTLKGHEGTVYCVTVLENFNNGSAVLLSSSYDKSIRVIGNLQKYTNKKTNRLLFLYADLEFKNQFMHTYSGSSSRLGFEFVGS